MQGYSVLMSVYAKDKPEYIKIAIDSMLNQTIPPEQFVIVLDGKVPDTITAVVTEYENRYPQVFTVVALAENGGLGHALNEGLRYCRNELVARMDADDISLPTRCERELEMFVQNDGLDICGCNIDEFCGTPDNVRTSRIVPETDVQIKRFMRRRQPFNHPSVIYRKSKVTSNGGYVELKRKEDFDLFSRMLSNDCHAANVGESLYLYRADKANYARRKSRQNFESALYVYWRHLVRKGCTAVDFMIICAAECMFMMLPCKMVQLISDRLLREKKY